MNAKNERPPIKNNEFFNFYINKVSITVLIVLFFITLFAPPELVFSQNVMDSGLSESFAFRLLTAILITLSLPLLLFLIQTMKSIWDSQFLKK